MSHTIRELFLLGAVETFKSKAPVTGLTVNDDLLVGLELEIENIPKGLGFYTDECHDIARGYWSVEEDGSLRPRGAAWEFISAPAPISHTIPELHKFFEHFQFTDKNYTDRCSVHVHANVLDWTTEQVANLAMVYPVFEEVLFHFVNHYNCPNKEGYWRDTNIYCIPWNQCRMNNEMVYSIMNTINEKVREWQKYTALNVVPVRTQGTVEWRHMHGTADMDKLTKWLAIIGAIMKFCKEVDMKDMMQTLRVLNDTSTYAEFFNAVLQGSLEYTEEYRIPMADGVVAAKYSLMNWGVKEAKPKKKDALDALRIRMNAAPARLERDVLATPPAPTNWDDWPPPPTPVEVNNAVIQQRGLTGAVVGNQPLQAVEDLAGFTWDGDPEREDEEGENE